MSLRSCALALFSIGLFFSLGCTKKPDYTNRVVVKVNDREFNAQDFAESLAERLKGFNSLSVKDDAVVNQAKTSVTQEFIVTVITEEWAKKNNIFVRKEQLDAEVVSIRKQYPDDIAFRKTLADSGVTYKEWEDQIRKNVLEKLVIQEIRKNAEPPSSQKIEDYYKEHKNEFQQAAQIRVRQVVLETEEQAKMIRKELMSGKSMASLAKKFSIAPERENEGDLGWVERGIHDIFDSAFRLGVGQKSQIIKSPFGYHIIEVTGRRAARTLPLAEAKPQIERILLAKMEQEAYSKWLEAELLKARVFTDDALINAIKVHTRSNE